LETSVDDMVKVFMSALNRKGLNSTGSGPEVKPLRPAGGAPNFPQKVPSHVKKPSVRKLRTGVPHSSAVPLSRPSPRIPHASGVFRVVASVATVVVPRSVLDATLKTWRMS